MKRQNIESFEEAVNYLLEIPRFTTKNTPEDTKAFLHDLGDPDKKLKIIHVAGTNGKGSVCAYMRYILEAAGYTTAVFTSPHLVDIRERFMICGKLVSKEDFLSAFLSVYDKLDLKAIEEGRGYHPTFFEYLFFMAMILFSKNPTDYCILETGLGGRLDATNSVSTKVLSVITRIGLDHVEYLGDTLVKIAVEKAGIMMRGVPVVFGDNDSEVCVVFCNRAKELETKAYSVSKEDYAFLNFKNKSIDFSVATGYYGYISLTLRTQARYQMENAALAVKAIEVLDEGRTITASHIRKGVESCVWQGRMEEILPQVYVDGAHNEDGIRAFLQTVKEDGWQGQRALLFGAVSDKAYEKMLADLVKSGLFRFISLVNLQTKRSTDAKKLLQIVEEKGASAKVYGNVEEALRELLEQRGKSRRIYIVGSLYLVGEAKAFCERQK